MDERQKWEIAIRLPAADPEVLAMLGYPITFTPEAELTIGCSKDAMATHSTPMKGEWATFTFYHEPTTEERARLEVLEKPGIPEWAFQMAGRIIELRQQVKLWELTRQK